MRYSFGVEGGRGRSKPGGPGHTEEGGRFACGRLSRCYATRYGIANRIEGEDAASRCPGRT